MTLPPIVRIFFAVDLHPSAKDALGQFISMLKKQSKTHAIRWTKPEALHITLQFLAEVRSEHIPALLKNVRTRVQGTINPSALRLGHLRLFPNPYRPRVIVMDILHNDALTALAATIGEGITATNYPIELRPFHPHLTIGRLKHPNVNLDFLTDSQSPDIGLLDLREFVLFRSEPQQEGSKYTVIETIQLGNTSEVLNY